MICYYFLCNCHNQHKHVNNYFAVYGYRKAQRWIERNQGIMNDCDTYINEGKIHVSASQQVWKLIFLLYTIFAWYAVAREKNFAEKLRDRFNLPVQALRDN